MESPEADEEELLADGGDAAPDLDEVLETEAEALAAELEQAENEGVDPNMLEQLEGYVENAAEALITMRDAKTRLQEVRRDRGFGKAGPGPSAGAGGKPSQGFKKRGVCHDCGLPGHWAGDAACNRPGAGLAKPKRGGRGGASPVSSAPSGSPHRPVQLVETFAAEAGGEEEEHVSHEVSVVSTLEQALEATCPREVCAQRQWLLTKRTSVHLTRLAIGQCVAELGWRATLRHFVKLLAGRRCGPFWRPSRRKRRSSSGTTGQRPAWSGTVSP